MSSSSDWEMPHAVQPKPENYAFDLEGALTSLVGLRAIIPADAFTAETLGTERTGNGVLIREGVVLTIGYLVTEAETIWLHLADGRAVPGHVLAYDQETGFGLVQALARPAGAADRAIEGGQSRRFRRGRRRRRPQAFGGGAHRRQAGIRRQLGICAR